MAEVVSHGHALDAPPGAQAVADKVHAPHLIDGLRQLQRHAFAGRLFDFLGLRTARELDKSEDEVVNASAAKVVLMQNRGPQATSCTFTTYAMDKWILYALFSMAFAGFTSVIAKMGLTGISGDLGLAVRTCFVFVFVLLFAGLVVPSTERRLLTARNLFWLGLSGVTTACSWVFYYRAIKLGEVSTVALIDKGSVVVALLLAWLLLGESITTAKLVGGSLILGGLIVIARG